MFRRFKSRRYVEPSLSGMTLRPSMESIIMRYTSVGLTSFLVALLAFSIFAPIQTTNAEEILFANQATGGAVSLTTSGDVNLSMQTSSVGTIRTALDAIRVTSGSAGYQLYLSTSSNVNSLVRDGATSTGTDANTGAPTYASSDIISAGGGSTINSPSTLSIDTWGFAVASTNSTSGSGSEDVVSTGFDSSYPVGDDSTPTSKFAQVPVSGSAIKIAERSSTANSVLTNVYYGINATSAKPSGLYKNTVVYTAIGSGSVAGLASVSPSRTNQLGGGETLTIATPSTLDLAYISSITIEVGGATCTNPSAVKNGSLVNLTCTSPALATGWHEAVATITTTSDTTETYVVNPGIEYYLDEGGSQVAVYMQDFTVTDCANMASLSSITLQDSRDNNIYRITKQADGNCWMTENLRLGNNPNNDGTISSDITLNSSNSDIPKGGNSFTVHTSDIQTTSGTDWSANYDTTHIYSFVNNNDVSTENKKSLRQSL